MSEPANFRTIECLCPTCGYKLDAATVAHGGQQMPVEGDTSLCLNCGQLLTYEANLALRKITVWELRKLMDDAEAWAMVEKSRRFIQQRGRFA